MDTKGVSFFLILGILRIFIHPCKGHKWNIPLFFMFYFLYIIMKHLFENFLHIMQNNKTSIFVKRGFNYMIYCTTHQTIFLFRMVVLVTRHLGLLSIDCCGQDRTDWNEKESVYLTPVPLMTP